MKNYTDESYGEHIAGMYDVLYGSFDLQAIDFLAELAGGGPALELGIGTGRIALPLKSRGVEVHGIDASPAMVSKLHAKPGGADIPVDIGSFADVNVSGEFSLIYVVFNTFFALVTQDDQIRCLTNAASHLARDGCLVIEAFVPDMARFTAQQVMRAIAVELDEVHIDVSRYDPVTQIITSQHIILTENGTRLFPVQIRYVWPSEMDLMARLAGLRLVERWGGWDRSAFSEESKSHISVYKKA
jgi:SAM-dependent methyltransferase